MPIFNFRCPSCGEHIRKLLPHLTEDKFCPKCETKLDRVTDGPTSRVVEVRDNGLMPRKVEQLQNVQELIHDRSTGSDGSGTV